MTDENGSQPSGGTPEEGTSVPQLIADRYEIGDLVGRSAMTETYRAVDRTTGATVAVKFLSRQLAEDTAFADQFVSDAQAAVAIHDPHIVSILDSGEAEGLRFLVQEYVEGDTLDRKLKREGAMEPAAASILAEQLLGALTVAHAAGITHKDINPGNILMTESGDAKLMDLGIARIESPQTVAQTRAIMGTAAYLSPEQAQGEHPDGRADIYSMGIVLYEMVAGAPPFSADSPIAVAYMHIRETPKPLAEVKPEVPPAIADAVMKALEKRPEDRFQSAAEFGAALARARGGGEGAQEEGAQEEGAQEEGAQEEGAQEEGAPKGPAIAPPPAAPKSTEPETMVFTSTSAGSGGPSRRSLIIIGVIILAALIGAFYYFFLMPHSVEIPNLIGVESADAQAALEEAGLNTRTIWQEDDATLAGTVIGQAPEEGTIVPAGSTVILTIARVPAEATVPNLVGLQRDEAETVLAKIGLEVGTVTEIVDEEGTPGSVTEQEPVSGTVVPTGSEVALVVVTSETTSEVPDLTCLSAERAVVILDEAGLKMTWAGVDPMGPESICPTSGVRVSDWDPATGTELPAGSVVEVWTNKPLPSPQSTGTTSPAPSPAASGGAPIEDVPEQFLPPGSPASPPGTG